jgi:hypothetical protein
MQKIVLQVLATLELNSGDFTSVDSMDLDKLSSCCFEIKDTIAPISIAVGNRSIRGEVRFVTPTPYELKVARLKSLSNMKMDD